MSFLIQYPVYFNPEDKCYRRFAPVKIHPVDLEKDKKMLQEHEHNKRYAFNLIKEARSNNYEVGKLPDTISFKDLKTYIKQLEKLLNIPLKRANKQDIARAKRFLAQAKRLNIADLPSEVPSTNLKEFITWITDLIFETKRKQLEENFKILQQFTNEAS